jgi:MFS family permease
MTPTFQSGIAEVTSWRSLVVAVCLFSQLYFNILDPQLFSAVTPALRPAFLVTDAQHRVLLGAFSVAYGICTPFFGSRLDRIGLRVSMSIVVQAISSFIVGMVVDSAGIVSLRFVAPLFPLRTHTLGRRLVRRGISQMNLTFGQATSCERLEAIFPILEDVYGSHPED